MCFFEIPEDLETQAPTESEMIGYVQYLRQELKRKSSTIWTTYSKLNSVVKGRYGVDLNTYHCLKSFIKTMDTDIKKKANIFSIQDIETFFPADLPDKYWLVRRVICILAYFGGLRLVEVMNLQVNNSSNYM